LCTPAAAAQSVRISASLASASTKTASAPASAKAAARQSASSRLAACRASVRATSTMRSAESAAAASRASAAARTRATASWRPTTRLPRTWPQLFGHAWSSISTPAKPAAAKPFTVRCTFMAFPYPVSASPISGRLRVASSMPRPWSSISA
jgi:hypothetical protein